MAQKKVSYWSTAVSLVTRTLPYIIANVVVYAAFFLISLIWFGVWGGLAFLSATFLNSGAIAVVFIIIGTLIFGGVVKFLRRYLLYMLKGAHIAAMTELLKGGKLPEGKGQFEYGQQVIKDYFADVSVLFLLDRLVDGALRTLQRRVLRITNWLPLGGSIKSVMQIITSIINQSLTYVDEAILSYAIYRGEKNVWNSARHGVLLYAQSFKPILITAAKIWLVGKVLAFVLFLVFMLPGGLVAMMVGNELITALMIVIALVASWAVKAALFEPFALAYTLVTYHYSIVGLTPDPTWDERLRKVSKKFRQLIGKAEENADAEPVAFLPAPAPQPHG